MNVCSTGVCSTGACSIGVCSTGVCSTGVCSTGMYGTVMCSICCTVCDGVLIYLYSPLLQAVIHSSSTSTSGTVVKIHYIVMTISSRPC